MEISPEKNVIKKNYPPVFGRKTLLVAVIYNVLSREVITAGVWQTPHSGYVTLCYFNHCQHKNHVTMVYHVIDSNLQPLFTKLLTAVTSRFATLTPY